MASIDAPRGIIPTHAVRSPRRWLAGPWRPTGLVGAAVVAAVAVAGLADLRQSGPVATTARVVEASAVVPGQQPTPPPPAPTPSLVDPPVPVIPTPAPVPTPVPAPDHVPFTVPQPESADPSSDWLGEAVSGALEWFFRELVFAGLNLTLGAVGDSLLATPTPQELPHLTEVWTATQLIAVAAYPLLMLFAGLILMGHGTVQSRYSLRELLPRVVVGFLAANLSWTFTQQATVLANALARAVLGDGVNPDTATEAITQLFSGDPEQGLGGLWLIFIGLAVVIMLMVLLITYVVRIAVFAILVVAAPLALSCHALPQLEPVAYWWWRAFAAVLAVQVAQSLTLVVALKVLFTPGQGYAWIGEGASDGWMNLFLAIALLFIMIKIPGWLLSAARIGSGRSVASSLVRSVIAYKTFGALAGRASASRSVMSWRRGGRGGRPPGGPAGGGRPGGPRRGPTGGPSPVGPGPGGPRNGGPRGGPRAGGGARRVEPAELTAAQPGTSGRRLPGARRGDPDSDAPRRPPQPPRPPAPPRPPNGPGVERPTRRRPAPVAATASSQGRSAGHQPAGPRVPGAGGQRLPAQPLQRPAAAPSLSASSASSASAGSPSGAPVHPTPRTPPHAAPHAPPGRILARSPQSPPAPSAPAHSARPSTGPRSSRSRPSPARPTPTRIPSRPPLRPAPTRW